MAALYPVLGLLFDQVFNGTANLLERVISLATRWMTWIPGIT